MLNKEEKEAIEHLNKKYKFISENPLATNVFTTLDTHNLGIILNYIDKLQQEVKGFKKENKRLKEQVEAEIHARDCVAHCSVSKNKIKDKIKELKENMKAICEKEDVEEYQCEEYYMIQVLEEILKEE